MGYEDSMIEAGFHDEEDYLEHLMDEYDKQKRLPAINGFDK